ncbi:Protein CHROMATIN REMODELING 5 [Camellia lanceoleosa]|uniref:Protein CHROMATIN REMODELING 5 n=1 Tax=Camellia lanceoleosa TaxID=1840588 RepID=A0ACC0GSB0_9ERIC|nr:Protein CHROMATIN REMODELING 5 [Camellia lanceoleosa]
MFGKRENGRESNEKILRDLISNPYSRHPQVFKFFFESLARKTSIHGFNGVDYFMARQFPPFDLATYNPPAYTSCTRIDRFFEVDGLSPLSVVLCEPVQHLSSMSYMECSHPISGFGAISNVAEWYPSVLMTVKTLVFLLLVKLGIWSFRRLLDNNSYWQGLSVGSSTWSSGSVTNRWDLLESARWRRKPSLIVSTPRTLMSMDSGNSTSGFGSLAGDDGQKEADKVRRGQIDVPADEILSDDYYEQDGDDQSDSLHYRTLDHSSGFNSKLQLRVT